MFRTQAYIEVIIPSLQFLAVTLGVVGLLLGTTAHAQSHVAQCTGSALLTEAACRQALDARCASLTGVPRQTFCGTEDNPGTWYQDLASDTRWDAAPAPTTSATPVRDQWCAGITNEQQCYTAIRQMCASDPGSCPRGSTATVDQARAEYNRDTLPPPPVEAGTRPSNVDLNNLGINPGLDISIVNPFRVNGQPVNSIEGVILALLNLLIVIVTPLIALAIIFAGFKYVTAQGNSGQVSEAHKAITYAIIGGVLVLGAITLSEVLRATIDSFRV